MNKRKEIIRLSITFIKKYSFQELSFSYLAAKLNISKAAIHYYFKNKINLGIAICEHLEKEFRKQLHYFENNYELSSWLSIQERIGFLSEDEICPVVSLQSDLNKYDKGLQEKVVELVEIEYQTYVQILSRKINVKQAETLAQNHLSSIKGAQIYNRTLSVPFEQTVLERIKSEIVGVEK